MRVSLNQVKQFIDFELPPVGELVDRINRQLGKVEEVIDLGDKYKDAIIVKVVECAKHPDADRLNITKIDDGGVVKDVPRDENNLVQVVCGAPNVRAGMLAVWLPPRSTVPASFDDQSPFVLDARELRGALSQGMLAATDELAIGSDHEGIVEITEKDIMPRNSSLEGQSSLNSLKLGASFAETYGLDDTIIDIENKMFTHRPDLFGQLGVAREIAGILGHKFVSPKWYLDTPEFSGESALPLQVFNDVSEKVPRFMTVAMQNVEIKPSPLWLQCALVAMGSKPINNVVDVTNYTMLITAQPTHAYDYDKLRGYKLGARMAKKGEKVKLLNNKTYELTTDDIVIADGEGPVGLAGIMGGGESEVDEDTKNIVLEVATFDMYTVRKSSMRHGVFTDALTRFNKGQSPLQNDRVLAKLIGMMCGSAGAKQASQVFDEKSELTNHEREFIDRTFISDRLGLDLAKKEIGDLLRNVEFDVCNDCEQESNEISPGVHYEAPFWRTDIELAEDIVEEVGRLYGFDKLPRELPRRSIKPAAENKMRKTKQAIRNNLSRSGANEVLTYSFVHEKLLKQCGQDPSHAFKLSNALSPDLQYYRLSLMPSLLDKVHPNIKAGYDEFALFELGKAHIIGQNDDQGLPREDELTALVVVANDKLKKSGASYYQAKNYLENLLKTKLTYQPVPEKMREFDITKPYDMNRTAFVYAGDKFLGIIGEFRTSVRQKLKLPSYTAGLELDTEALVEILTHQTSYLALSRFPSVTQDITLQVPADLAYQELHDFISNELVKLQPADTLPTLESLGIYQSNDDQSHKNISLRLSIVSYDRTLRAEEVNALLDKVAHEAGAKYGAARV